MKKGQNEIKIHFDPSVDSEALSIKTRKWKYTTPGFTYKCLCTLQKTPCLKHNIHPGYPKSNVHPNISFVWSLQDKTELR